MRVNSRSSHLTMRRVISRTRILFPHTMVKAKPSRLKQESARALFLSCPRLRIDLYRMTLGRRSRNPWHLVLGGVPSVHSERVGARKDSRHGLWHELTNLHPD